MRYVALLRGINVGGHAKLSMGDLRTLLLSLGYTDVVTYLQSGNVVLTSPRTDLAEMVREIEQQIAADLAVETKILLRTPEEMAMVVEANPFPDAVTKPTTLHVVFLSERADRERLAAIDPQKFAPDEFRAVDREIYLYLPNGAGNSKLGNAITDRRLGLVATARNWNTVMKLLALSSK